MGKILYPVGTEVQVRNHALGKQPNGSNTQAGKRVVLKYTKGSDKPYTLSMTKDTGGMTIASMRQFSVKEIKSYREAGSKVSNKSNTTAPSNCLTHDEVAKIVRDEVKALVSAQAELSAIHDAVLQNIEAEVRSIRVGITGLRKDFTEAQNNKEDEDA